MQTNLVSTRRLPDLTDDDLLQQAQRGDSGAFEILVRDEHLAQDVLQHVCWLLWTSVLKIGDLGQGYQPSLLHCRHKEIHEQNFENRQASTQ